MMVRITATKEMEQPTMEMISRASLWPPFSCDMYKIWLLAASMLLKALFYKPNTTLNFQEKRRWIDFAAIPFLERFQPKENKRPGKRVTKSPIQTVTA